MATDSYVHKTVAGNRGGPLLFAFHGTGGDENQFLGLGPDLLPGAKVVAPRGDVSEHGAARYFRRTGEGVYDMADLSRATAKMADFVRAHVEEAGPSTVIGLGYSNGANILASVLFHAPSLFDAAVLMHPLIPFTPHVEGDLSSTRVLVTAGKRDPICPPALTVELDRALRDLSADVELFWHDGGHEIREGELTAAGAFLAPYRPAA
ncbi:alpha/beta hydrolase [Mesorhizobium sp. CAU 1741]|uniref:alpha/beta hydrolase n=1 Tax=Mesorhizobium sp. CAU 1741 TaxID=3140366 RepID=UPI00325BA4EB